MLKRMFSAVALGCALASAAFAQNTNSPAATRPRTSTPAAQNAQEGGTPQAEPTPRAASGRRAGRGSDPTSKDVLDTFNSLVAGIQAADVDAVTALYWNSPQLVLFNNNGTVTRGWEQMRKNRESSYPKLKDVKLDVRDVRVQMLGRDGAVVAFLWTQSQTYDGTPDTATGRTTLVFRRIAKEWKVVHAHISTDAPDQSRVPQAERTTPEPTPTPKATP